MSASDRIRWLLQGLRNSTFNPSRTFGFGHLQLPLIRTVLFPKLVIVLLFCVAGCGRDNGVVLEETFEHVYSIQPNADISIQNHDGSVLVYGSNTNEVQVHATKKAYHRARLQEIAVNVSVQPSSASIRVTFPPKPTWAFFDQSGTVDCTVVIPASGNLSTVRLDAGEVFLDGIRGQSVHAWLGDGRIFAHNCFSDVNLALRRGNLSISYDWWETRRFSVQANIARGNTWAFLPTNAAFHLFAETAYGKIGNDFDDPPIARPTFAKAAKIDMLVHGGGSAAIKVLTTNGDIRIIEANP
jgi:hypothetical protein